MTINLKTCLLAAAAIAPAATLAPAALAQTTSVAVIDPASAILGAKAIGPAWTSVSTQYKAAFDSADARQRTLATVVEPLGKKLDTNNDGRVDQAELAAAQAAKRPELIQIQAAQQAAETDIGRTIQPARLAQAWIIDQAKQKYPAALQSVATTKRLGLVLTANDAAFAAPAADVTDDVTAAINLALPTASTTPPANWQPDQQTVSLYQQFTEVISAQARAQAAAAQRQAPTPAPAPGQPAAQPARPTGR